jgi:3-phosphoshikimate 1-carboxyvinyltransferase
MVAGGSVVVHPVSRIEARLRVPGDKSISHRYVMLAALAPGRSTIRDLAPGADCQSTLRCLEALGAQISVAGSAATIIGRGPGRFSSPAGDLDAGNSGTTTRLLAGILAAQRFASTITGDDSLRRRPMRRVIVPLTRMGAEILSRDACLPMTIRGGDLQAIDYHTEVPSAQVKSAVLLAGLHASGTTRVTEPHATRNHTELALRRFGARVEAAGTTVSIAGGQVLSPADVAVPGDISSAVFWFVAAAGVGGSFVEVDGVGLNPTRVAVLDVLRRAGAGVETEVENGNATEPVGRVRVRHRELAPVVIGPNEVPALIDELPALAALATHGGDLTVTGAAELRVKESDRITALVRGLRSLGATAEELPDGFHVAGSRRLEGGVADAEGDHRLAMAFAVAALGARRPSTITGAGAVDVSYPGFFDVLQSIAP